MKYLLSLLFIALLAYFAMGVYLYIKQRDMLYFPTPSIKHPFETFTLKNEGENINVIVANPNRDKAIIYFGGNADIVAEHADELAKNLQDYTIYLMEYRGFGKSTGTPTEAGIFSDAKALYDRIRSNHDNISIIGRSLGTGVACYLASKRDIEKLLLITPFDSATNVAKDLYPIFPISLILKDRYDSLSRVPHIMAKTMILIAQNDTVVPPRHAYNLASAFPKSQVVVQEISGARHNDIIDKQEYIQALKRFFNER